MKKVLLHATPVLLAILIFSSNFLSTNLFGFDNEFQNFSIWFVLSFFCFACGWLIDKTLGWIYGGKIVFAISVSTVFLTVMLVFFFRDYFHVNDPSTENLILYSLRNIYLGAIGYFGMVVPELIASQRENEKLNLKIEFVQETIPNAKKEAENTINESKIKSEKILQQAEVKLEEINIAKRKIEDELSQLIITERELLKQFENKE
ncbi:MAG: hypothetical protein JW866_10380 [Ignavibacteriales bacterium]|nr:hypothetical protein [Ignavibacteriales bacterium]